MSDDVRLYQAVFNSEEALRDGDFDIEALHRGDYDHLLYFQYWRRLRPEDRAAVLQEQNLIGERIRQLHERHTEILAKHGHWMAKDARVWARQTRYRYFQERIAELDARSRDMENDREAVQRLREAAEVGDAGSQNNLGYLYYHGRGVEQDYEQAEHWFRLAADQNHPDGLYNLGYLYYHGRGVAQNYVEANFCFEVANHQYELSLSPVSRTPKIGSSFGILTEGTRKSGKRR